MYGASESNGTNSLEHLNRRMPPSMMAKSNLDAAMGVFFSYIKINCNKAESNRNSMNEKRKESQVNGENNGQMHPEFNRTTNSIQIYRDLLKCFEAHILPAHATGHVQFSLFYFLSTNTEFYDQYLKYLWAKFISPNVPQILRQASMAYIASFISRAHCVNKVTLMSWLKKVCNRNFNNIHLI